MSELRRVSGGAPRPEPPGRLATGASGSRRKGLLSRTIRGGRLRTWVGTRRRQHCGGASTDDDGRRF
jgi:hypothetical protein